MGGLGMKISWFHRMIWSYIPIFLIICSFIFFIFFHTLTEQNKKSTVKANEVSTAQIMQSIDVSLKTIDHTIVNEMMNEPIYQQFFNQTHAKDVAINYRVTKRLNMLKQGLPMVESVYLIRYGDELIFNGNLIHPFLKSEDQEFINGLKQGRNLSKWTGLRQYRHFSLQDYKNVVSLVRKYPLNVGEQGLFVVNVSSPSIQAMVETITDTTTVFVNIYDREGNHLFGSRPSEYRGSVLSRMTSEYTGWTIEGGLVNGAFINTASILFDVWFVLGLLVFVLGIISIIYVTRRNYRPLKELIAKIDTYLRRERESLGDVRADEFSFLQGAIDNFIAKSESAGKQFEEVAQLKKKSFFSELINGYREIDPNLLHLEMEKHNLEFDCERLAVVVIEIDQYEEVFQIYKERDRYLFKFVLNSVANEMLGTPPLQVWLEWISEHQLAGILFMKTGDAEPEEACERLSLWVQSNLKFTVTMGLGSKQLDWHGVSRSLKEAISALQYKPVMGSNRLIPYTVVEANQTTESAGTTEAIQVIHELVESFRLNEPEWSEKLHDFFNDMKRRLCTKDDILILIHYFIYYLDLQISQLPKEYRNIWKGKTLSGILETVKRLETLELTEENLTRILKEYAEQAKELREDKGFHALMKEIRGYIEEDYANPELSLDYLSDKFEINPKYVSQLFKEEFGENFLDFLMRKRIEEAKRMLLSESHSIREIGDQVGYTNATTFRRVFKKVVGFSPVDYRKQSELE
jgi:two-component system response regulator YesN